MVGVGTQDSLGEADDFVDMYGTTFPMLWDETFETWNAFGVTAQPAAVLIGRDMQPINGWLGPFPEDEVVSLASADASS